MDRHVAITELSRSYGAAWASFDGTEREHLISEFSSGRLGYDLIDRHRAQCLARRATPVPGHSRSWPRIALAVLDVIAAVANGISWVLLAVLSLVVIVVGVHVVPAVMSRDSPPVVCQITGGTWSLWSGWNC